MELFHRILKTAVEGGASDVHVKIGSPVVFRINRQLVAIECPFPTQEGTNKVAQTLTPDRFRPNLFHQRGQWCLAMRYVRTQVPGFEDLGLLPQVKKLAEAPRGILLVA